MLTRHQGEALQKALDLLENNNNIIIQGSAGTGKTFLVNELILRLILSSKQKEIYCTAPTNKAVKVLSEKVDAYDNVSFLTTHSALKMKRSISRSGKVSFKPNNSTFRGQRPLDNVSILIVDEASMLNTAMITEIKNSSRGCKVIYLGDNKQINPVGESTSPIFLTDYPVVTLTEIIRQSESNPIIELSMDLSILNRKESKKNDTGGYIYTDDQQKIIQTLAAANGTNELKFLAYTNRTVDAVNRLVRTHLYGVPAKIELGENLIFNSPYDDIYHTSQEIKVEDVLVREKKFGYVYNTRGDQKYIKLKYYSINPYKSTNFDFPNKDTWDTGKKEDVISDNILVIHEDSEELLKETLKDIVDLVKEGSTTWPEYYKFLEGFADLKYSHALTVHKSQGSTYEKVIIDVTDINSNRDKDERKRLLYTAITRASDLLIIYNK